MEQESIEQTVIDGLRDRVDPMLEAALARSFDLGFLGSMPIAEQIDHALGFVAVIESLVGSPPESVIDLGTGGGVPGLVLISCWQRARVVLMDANERRTAFLGETVGQWPSASLAEVVRGRAEELGRVGGLREQFAVVTSRSFGMPALTAECGSSFLSPGGWMVVSEPPGSDPADRWPADGAALVGLDPHAEADEDRAARRRGRRVVRGS